MTTAETIYERVKTLPEGQVKLVLTILQVTLFFLDRSQALLNWFGHAPSSTRSKRLALSQQAKGRFAHLPNSSDNFAERKQAEIDWEDRHQ